MESKKNPEVDLEKKKSLYFQIGLVSVLALVLLAFEWRTYDISNFDLGQLMAEEIEEEIIPITQQQPPPPPPPVVEIILNIVEDEEEIEEEIEMDEVDDDMDMEIEAPEETIVEDEIFTIVEEMPSFKGCEGEGNEQKRNQCTQQKIMEFLGDNIKYPQIAKEAGQDGRVFISFVVSKSGKINDVQLLRGVAGAKTLDKEAMRVVNLLPDFKPGKQRGKPVSVRYNLPVNFTLR